MKVFLLIAPALIGLLNANAQSKCVSHQYEQQRILQSPALLSQTPVSTGFQTEGTQSPITGVIRIPVVIHNLYHTTDQKITDAQVASQLKTLNDCFRKRNADTSSTPSYFKSLAADCEIEFVLAVSDSRRRSTTGIIRKYTPVTAWEANDKMKSSAQMGSDGWDPSQYLNIWVCSLTDFAGYASVPGDVADKDGIVIGLSVFGGSNKTVVHEIGHWLSLRHLWGDDYCGDDGIGDTPKQASYTMGCPGGKRLTCGNSANGDMYMNYMDFTDDACTNLFTSGQKTKMRTVLSPGGQRASFLASVGLQQPLIFESPLPEQEPTWLRPNLYPVPASNSMTLDVSYDPRWVGSYIYITNLQGQLVKTVVIGNKLQVVDIRSLQPGIYFLAAKKADGESMKQKFIKL